MGVPRPCELGLPQQFPMKGGACKGEGRSQGSGPHSGPRSEAQIVEVKKQSFDDQYFATTGPPQPNR
jgi:hypothetical protein